MKNVSLTAFLLFLAPLLFFSSAHAQNAAPPQMVIPEPSYDFKEVSEGSVLEHTFQVLNKGGQVLEIMKVSPG